MVRLLTASSPIEAKVLAARLGAEGIVWELRGSVDGPLAIGPIDVLVDEHGLDDARALLLIDEVEATFAGDERPPAAPLSVRHALVVVGVVVLLVLFALARMAARV